MLGKRLINPGGGVACTTDTTQILDGGTTQSTALYRFEDNAYDTAYASSQSIVSSNKVIDLNVNGYSSGSTIADSTSNSNNATIVGNVTYSNPSGSNGRFNLDGASDYLRIGGSTTFNSAANFTVEGWFKPDNITDLDHFFTIWDGGSNSKLYLRFTGTSGDLDGYAYTSGGGQAANVVTSNASVRVQVNKFNHIVMTYTDGGSGSLAVYINGALAGSATPSAAVNTTGAEDLYVGILKNYAGSYDFDGEVGQVRFYSSALTAAEVLQNFNATRALYAAYDGAASGVTYVTGKFGKAAELNGSTGFVNIENMSTVLANDFTVSMWVKTPSSLATSGYPTFLSLYGYTGSGSAYGWSVEYQGLGASSKITFYWVSSSGVGNSLQSATISPNTWYHVLVKKNASSASLYINGQLDHSGGSSISSYAMYYNTITDLTIGAKRLTDGGSISSQFTGLLDQVRLFTTQLSIGEINSLYNETTTTAALGTISNPSTVAYYKMADATDETGSYNATTVNNVDFNVEGKYGFAGKFNGTNSYMTTGLTWPGGTQLSWSGWIKTSNTKDTYICGDFASGGANASHRFSVRIYSQNFQATINNAGGGLGTSVTFGTFAHYGEWAHLVVTIDGTTLKGYVNGSQLGSAQTSSESLVAGANPFVFGNYGPDTGTSQQFDGTIDQVRIFNKAISASEVTKLYNEIQCANTITTPESYFNTKLYTGNGSTQSITGLGFKPDLTWIKSRASVDNHNLGDSVRGVQEFIYSNLTSQELTSANYLTSFDTDGFSIGSDNSINKSSDSIVSWNWKAGGILNQSASFNGSNSYIYANNSVQQPTTNFSVSVWSRWDSKPSGSVGLVGNFKTGVTPQVGFLMGKHSGENIFSFYADGTASSSAGRALGTTNFVTGQWYHTVGTYDGSNVKIYVNGVLEGTTSYTATPGTTDQPLVIGRWYGNYNAYYHDGEIDQVRIFNKAISDSEVTTLYNETASTINTLQVLGDTSCVAAYPLGTGAGDLENTYSSIASNVTFNNPGHLTRNTNGTIESTVSASQESGFSIVTYSPNNTVGMSIGHGLSQAPSLVITKRLDTSQDWGVYTNASTGNATTNWLSLNDADAYGSGNYMTLKSTTLELPAAGAFWASTSSNQVAYCFANVDGYQRIGSYVGNGSANGPFVYTGFEPAWLMIKRTDSTGEWNIFDNKRDTENPRDVTLWAQDNVNESTASQSGLYDVDFLANGFQIKNTYNPFNNSSGTYIFMAIAGNPDTTAPTKANSFKAITWAGSGGARNITTVGFKPDLVLWKAVDSASYNWKAINSIRGASKNVYPNLQNAEASDVATTDFIDNGFSFGSGGNGNISSLNFVGYAWKGLDHDRNLAAINTDGIIPSIISANPAAGFSLVLYNAISNTYFHGVGHGLNAAPQVIIQKRLTGAASNWYLITTVIDGSTDYFKFNDVDAKYDMTGTHANFTLGAKAFSDWWNPGQDIINYCFHSVDGISRISSYTGVTGAKRIYTTDDGTSTGSGGFSPSFIIIRNVFAAGAWMVYDSARSSTPDPLNKSLMINYASIQVVQGTYNINVHSDGFTVNSNLGATNSNGNTYFYIAFA